ncbi:MAG: MarR family transcriptional regulator [Burkholderiales bacterium]|jgi:DNA-binding MarR family transcriptional regulator|nr:MarR family transcriptional regulator [Burkholderiales bacterium]
MDRADRLSHPQALDDLLLYRIARLMAAASAPVIRLCEGRFGITRREWRLIVMLARDGEMQPSRLAERIQLDRARTSRAITSLVAKKLVARSKGTGDRRQAVVVLTPQGHALHDELFPLVREINQELLGPLAVAELRQLDAVLGTLQARADAMVLTHADLPKANRRRGGGPALQERAGAR